jgi:hypothetical protein
MSEFDFDKIESITRALKRCEEATRAELDSAGESDHARRMLRMHLATNMALQVIASELSAFARSLRRIGI